MRWALGIGGVVVIGALVAATYLPITKYERLQVCLYCGAKKQDQVVFGFRRSYSFPTAFEAWFDRRVALAHEHGWREEFTLPVTAENLWGTCWVIEKGRLAYGTVEAYEKLGRWLLRLESLQLDVNYWREVVHRDEARSEMARFLPSEYFFVDGPDDDVRDLFSMMMDFLENSAAWHEGFRRFGGTTGIRAPTTSRP